MVTKVHGPYSSSAADIEDAFDFPISLIRGTQSEFRLISNVEDMMLQVFSPDPH